MMKGIKMKKLVQPSRGRGCFYMQLFSTLSLFFGSGQGLAESRPLIQTDLKKVLQTQYVGSHAPQVLLNPGLYIVGDEQHEGNGTQYLLVDTDVNNPERFIGLMIPERNFKQGSVSQGKFFVGRPIRGGTSVLLAPLVIDTDGHILVDSELSRNSPVLEVSAVSTEGSNRYPYLIEGHNGALNGQVFGMRAVESNRKPTWTGWPSAGIFVSPSSEGKMVVKGNTISIHDGLREDRRYTLVPLNGVLGKIAGLKESHFDTMAETDVSTSRFSKIAFFLNGLSDEEIFVFASPMVRPGDYSIEFFSPKRRSFNDIFRPGKFQH